ncbi:MAG: DNA-3-methyladenine glycosylase I [Candidatus Acidiferrum sp.]
MTRARENGDNIVRCPWASNPLNSKYHDEEWGVPVHDDHRWFEFLILEGAQAGLSWDTILQKRQCYRELFCNFDPAKVARFNSNKVRALLRDPGIVRNRLKIASTISNARAFLRVQEEFGSFDKFIWQFVGGSPIQNHWKRQKQLPTKTPLSIAMSKELLRRGFRFVGPTICYAFMQATGIVNDHLITCHRFPSRAKRGIPLGSHVTSPSP